MRQVITFGKSLVVVGSEKGKDITLQRNKGKDKTGSYVALADVDESKTLVLRFESVEGLDVLQEHLNYIRLSLTKKQRGSK